MRIALWVAFAHALNDAYAAFVPPLLPRMMDRAGLSVSMAATLLTLFFLAQALLQPLAGWIADHFGRRAFVVAGPLMGGLFLATLGWVDTFTGMAVLLVLGGLGSALFHPPGASLAVRVTDGGRSGRRMSLFTFSGAAGFASGPLIAVGAVGLLGDRGLAWLMLPAIVLTPVFWRSLPADPPPAPGDADVPGVADVGRLLLGPLGLVFAISALSSFVQRAFLTFMPMVAAQDGRSEAVGALILTVYMVAQAFGSLTGGLLSDRVDRSRLLAMLTLFTVPAHLVAFAAPSGTSTSLVAAAIGGFLNMAIIPPVVILAQESMPRGASIGSGISMGLAWATGTLLLLPTGMLGDVVGPRSAALWGMPILWLGTVLAFHPSLRPAPRRMVGVGPAA